MISVKPNFLIIGATKAATTSLSSLLHQHPEAAIVQGKEPHFFSYDHNYNLGWERYIERYNHCIKEKAIGDASTSYSRIRYHPAVITRIKAHLPDAKIIYMVRHPLERMESAYVERVATPGSTVFNSVSDAVSQQPMIVDSSRYWEVFDAYRQQFPENNIKIVWFEEYITNRTSVYQDICRFLGIDDKYNPESVKDFTNDRSSALDRMKQLGRGNVPINTTWDTEVRQGVIDLIRDDNLKLLSYFGKPSDYWGDLFSRPK